MVSAPVFQQNRTQADQQRANDQQWEKRRFEVAKAESLGKGTAGNG